MSNPKDWFRRRRSEPLSIVPREPGDPFEGETILDLGRDARLVTLESHQQARSAASERQRSQVAGRDVSRARIPPPPPRSNDMRPARTIEPQAFSVRPRIAHAQAENQIRAAVGAVQAESPIRAAVEAKREEPAAEEPKMAPKLASPQPAAPESQPAMRSRAVPLGRPVLAAAAAPLAQPGRDAHSPAAEPARLRTGPAAEARPATGGSSEPVPAFSLAAPGLPWMRNRPLSDGGAANAVLREAFTPTRPKQQGTLFSGRFAQMQRIIAAIEEERAHIVLYGERGSGKTSLANIISAKAEEAGYFVVKFACSSELSFDEMFHTFLRRIPATFLADGIGATNRAGIGNFDELVAPDEIGIAELVAIFSRLHDKHVILVIDEYDRVTNEDAKNKLAELIKNMSDASVPVTLLIIGVAGDVDDLLGKHPSLQRALVTIPLPLMAPREIDGIIAAGELKSGLQFAPPVRQRIVDLAQGLPYHAQLLCLFAARSAVRRRSRTVEREDLRYAVQRAAEEAEGKIKEAYNLAIVSQGGSAFKDILFAAARCSSDEFGSFTVADVAQAAVSQGTTLSTLSLQFPLKKLTEASRGAMLRRVNTIDGLRYQFANQMMRHYVLVRQAVERGLV